MRAALVIVLVLAVALGYAVGVARTADELGQCRVALRLERLADHQTRAEDHARYVGRLEACLEANRSCALAAESIAEQTDGCRRFLSIGGK